MIPVTKPFVPAYTDVEELLKGVWERNWWTNNGPLLREYSNRLSAYLDAKHVQVVGNGTQALQLASKALNLSGNVLTTPFSYVATTSSLVWEGLNPVFVDVDPDTMNINPSLLERAVDEHTTAIVATHCFGNACAVEEIDRVAKKYKLKVIYDAAHAFGTLYRGKSIFQYGDVSTLSLHATKPVHCVEGGAVIAKDPELLKKVFFMHNFGHNGPEDYYSVGINAKNSEMHAAVGLAVLKHASAILADRKRCVDFYRAALDGQGVGFQETTANSTHNCAYFPVLFPSESALKRAMSEMESRQIIPRRYFYPTLNQLPYVKHSAMAAPVAEDLSRRILCLPLYFGLEDETMVQIADLVIRSLHVSGYYANAPHYEPQDLITKEYPDAKTEEAVKVPAAVPTGVNSGLLQTDGKT